ncbi:Unconventional myosin-VI [Dirofilaria immitis]
MAKRLHIKPPSSFKYLKHGCTQFFSGPSTVNKIMKDRRGKQDSDLPDGLLDDYTDFQRLLKGLCSIGFDMHELNAIFDIVAAILHLGDIHFVENIEDTKDGCIIEPSSKMSLHNAALLLGLNDYELKNGLITRVMRPGKGGVKVYSRILLKLHEASAARNALAKAIYNKLFDTIVARINKYIPFGSSISYIGVLDIAGFEFFTMNSFEQFCINYCNEKLQNFFNNRILKQEQELYAREGLNVGCIDYDDNDDCIDLFERKVNGLLDLLDEETHLPKPSSHHFTICAHQQLKNHFRLTTPRKSKLREHREIRDDEGLLIRHFADNSNAAFLRSLFSTNSDKSQDDDRKKSFSNKLTSASVSNKFRTQLTELLKKLHLTNTNFVRCIKPNSKMEPNKFEGAMILSQLKCAGMTKVLKLMQEGCPSRVSFAELYKTYEKILPSKIVRLDPHLFCKCLFHALGLNETDFKFGQTKIFFRPGKFAEFDQMLPQEPVHLENLVKKVQIWLLHVQWKKVQYGVFSCIKFRNKILWRTAQLTKIQSALRGYLARKIHRPRLHLYHRTNMLWERIMELEKMLEYLSSASQSEWSSVIKGINIETEQLLKDIKISNDKLLHNLKNYYKRILQKIDSTYFSLRQHLAKDEQRKIEQMEEKQRSEANKEEKRSLKKQKSEQQCIERAEFEERRKRKEKKYHRQQEMLRTQNENEKDIKCQRNKKLKQEKLDDEFARLARKGSTVQMIGDNIARKEKYVDTSKYDLKKYKYVELRDIINTSTDNKGFSSPSSQNSRTIQRYFKVPFAKPDYEYINVHGGMWYAHFDGQWIARQMELYSNKKPTLLIAGQDDMEMCELPLDATQLTRKKAALEANNSREMYMYNIEATI